MPITPWVTSIELQQAVADDLHKGDKTNLRARWVAICDRSVARGTRDLYTRLVTRGYTVAQLEAWDDRASFAIDQSLFWAFVEGSGLADYSDRDYNKLDHRKEIEDALFAILINGEPVLPGQEAAGTSSIMGGRIRQSTGHVSRRTFRTQRDRRHGWAHGGPWGEIL